MSVPASRKEFKDYCLRKLGAPVLNIMLSEDQIDDRVDEALLYYYDYHFDGSEKVYYKHLITANNRPDSIYDLTIKSGGNTYSNTDTISFVGGGGVNAAASIITNGNGVITSVNLSNNGSGFRTTPTITINTSTGTGAEITAELGGFIPIPENIIGVVNIFDISDAFGTNNMFNIRYQIALNDLYTLTSVSMIPYYMAMSHLQFLQQLLVGRQPLRYNRHINKAYIDMDWNRLGNGEYLIVEAYRVVDPNDFTNVWGDRWLSRYATCLLKQQMGTVLTRYDGMTLPNGIKFDARKMYDDASLERDALEKEMIYSYSLPVTDMIG